MELEALRSLIGDPCCFAIPLGHCASLSSFMVCVTQLMVGVPRMTGILVENALGSSRMKRT